MDSNSVIKVADFGLSEDVYARNYFRQGKEEGEVKLPVRWMALESLQDGIFTEKTDVVRGRLLFGLQLGGWVGSRWWENLWCKFFPHFN